MSVPTNTKYRNISFHNFPVFKQMENKYLNYYLKFKIKSFLKNIFQFYNSKIKMSIGKLFQYIR